MPVEFISLAEETGMIGAIGMWVLETACRQLKLWENTVATKHLKIAVNVSARQFRQVDFVEQVTRLVEDMQINPKLLVLELTESLILDNVDDAVTKMQAIKPLGIGFSMDDFGTGQSSLTYLKRLPLNELKIDSSFVRDITTDANDAVIVQTIIGMARNLGLHVIAEGVEDEDQLAFLVKNDCFVF
jgi:EAL domain-containing protein (putative c-di-GMP-specific phosphodiesterase class I)